MERARVMEVRRGDILLERLRLLYSTHREKSFARAKVDFQFSRGGI